MPRRAIVEVFVWARVNQSADVTAEADEVLAEVGKQIEALRL